MPPRTVKKSEAAVATPVAQKVAYPYVCVTVCGTPEQTGVMVEKIKALRNFLTTIGLADLIAYAPPLTAVDMMGLMGWETESKDGAPFGEEYLFKDYYGKKVRCSKNVKNRPIYNDNLLSIQQDILNCRWELNGETIIVSDTGNVLDGQHTAISVVIAQQRLESEKDAETGERIWAKNFPNGTVAIPKIVVYGIKGTDQVVNTMNTCRPRSFADVLYRSSYFANLPSHSTSGVDRQGAAVLAAGAVKYVWQRTGIYMSSSPRRTNSEAVAWLEDHGGPEGKFIACVRHILEEDKDGKFRKCGVAPDYAACAMWLMSCGGSDEEKYYSAEDRTDKLLTWKHYKQAMRFWTEFGKREPNKTISTKDGEQVIEGKPTGDLKALTEVLDEMTTEAARESGVGIKEIDYVITATWNRYVAGEKITVANVRLKDSNYSKPDPGTGVRTLINRQRFGNIDMGIEKRTAPKTTTSGGGEDETSGAVVVSADEQKKVADEIRTEHAAENKRLSEKAVLAEPADPAKTLKASVQADIEKLHVANPDVQVILLKNGNGKFETWGDASKVVAGLLAVKPSEHPNGTPYLKIDVSEVDGVCDKITDAGYTVAMADRINGVPTVTVTCRPKASRKR